MHERLERLRNDLGRERIVGAQDDALGKWVRRELCEDGRDRSVSRFALRIN